MTKVGGNYDRHFDWNEIKVDINVLTLASELPMWSAVPLASKSGTFSHSLDPERSVGI